VTGFWEKFHNEELHNLYSSSNNVRAKKSRRMTRARNVAIIGAKRNVCRIEVGKPEGERSFRNLCLDRLIGGQ
jgi:hypothetical protein